MSNTSVGRLFDYAETSIFGLPDTGGVYAVCINHYPEYGKEIRRERILYIGSSKNMNKRVCNNMRHPYRVCYNRFDDFLVYTRSIETPDYIELEKYLIMVYKPLLNKHGKK